MGLDPAPDQTTDSTLDLPTTGHVCREPELEEEMRHLEIADRTLHLGRLPDTP